MNKYRHRNILLK